MKTHTHNHGGMCNSKESLAQSKVQNSEKANFNICLGVMQCVNFIIVFRLYKKKFQNWHLKMCRAEVEENAYIYRNRRV